jgi:ACDE family multidrug resistance protein
MQTTKRKIFDLTFEDVVDLDDSAEQQEEAGGKSAGRKGKSKGLVAEFIALSSAPLVLVFGNSMLIPILPELSKQLGVSQFQSSLVITLFSVTAGLFIPIAGYLSDRFSRKAIMIPCLIIYGGGGILAGLGAIWDSYPILIAARAVQGLGAAGTSPIAMALIGDMYNKGTESKALGLIEAANGTGKVLSPIIGSLLALLVWYAPFFVFPLFCLLALLAIIWLIREPDNAKEPPKIGEYMRKIGSIFREKGRWLITSFFAGSLALFILFGVLFYLSDILEKPPYSIDGVLKGLILAIPLLGMVVTSYTTGSVIKKNGILIRLLMNIGLALMTVSLASAIFFYKNIYVLISLLTLSSIGTGLLLPCLNTMITGAVQKSERGMITSLYSSLRFLGVAFGPPLFGWMMGISHQTIFITVSILSLISLGFVLFLIRPGRQVS